MATTITPDLITEISTNGGFTYDPTADMFIRIAGQGFGHHVERAMAADARINDMLSHGVDYSAHACYVTADGTAGFAVSPDGDLQSVFNYGQGGRGDALVTAAIGAGARTLDCFDGFLPGFYSRHGFTVVRRESNWTPGGPDVVYMIGNGSITREAFASAVADVLTEHAAEIDHGAVLGGWYSADRDVHMVELTKIHKCSREHAIAIGEATGQEAIFDLATGEEIPTGGTGDGPPATPASVATWDALYGHDIATVATVADPTWDALYGHDATTPAECTETDHEHCPLHGCVAYVCCAPVATPADAWHAADAPAAGWAAYLRANPIIGNLIF